MFFCTSDITLDSFGAIGDYSQPSDRMLLSTLGDIMSYVTEYAQRYHLSEI